MREFGLIGYPLSHSFSQKYFSEKFQREKITDCRYENFSIPAIDQLESLLSAHQSLEGLNVTIPYKEQVISFLDEANEVVKQTRACNCIHIRDGKRYGYNTDVFGFAQSLKKYLRPIHTHALVLGTGGASKAVEYVLRQSGIEYKLVTRRQHDSGSHYLHYDQLTPTLMRSFLLIINATPAGMFPHTEQCPALPYEALSADHYLYDLVYNPAKTLFLQKGEEQGAAIQNGMDMLMIQAEESWKIWNSPAADL